jgi:hypothetical protein
MDHAILEAPLTYQSLDATNTKSDSLGGVARVREIVHARGFGPEDFALLAWQQVEPKYAEGDRKASKERLASIVVALAQAWGVLAPQVLEEAACRCHNWREWRYARSFRPVGCSLRSARAASTGSVYLLITVSAALVGRYAYTIQPSSRALSLAICQANARNSG